MIAPPTYAEALALPLDGRKDGGYYPEGTRETPGKDGDTDLSTRFNKAVKSLLLSLFHCPAESAAHAHTPNDWIVYIMLTQINSSLFLYLGANGVRQKERAQTVLNYFCVHHFLGDPHPFYTAHARLKVLNHASRTLPRFPYTNLKKSRTEKKLVTEHTSRDSLQGK